MKLNIIYFSETGNTEKMAEAVLKGAQEAGAEVKLINIADASLEDVLNADRVALGCPAKGSEELEEEEMEPFVESLSDKVEGKKMGLFGSYEWAEGEWMETWTERMKEYGADLVVESLIAYDEPDDEALEKCEAFGKALVK